MRNQTYTTRRGNSTSWAMNQNMVRHTPKSIGIASQSIMLGFIVLLIGLVYVAEGAKATGYDYDISDVQAEISELNAKKEDLAVERARLTSATAVEQSEVAMAMEDATVGGYAKE